MSSLILRFAGTAKRVPWVYLSLVALFLPVITSGCRPALSPAAPSLPPAATLPLTNAPTPKPEVLSPAPSPEPSSTLEATEAPAPAGPRIVPCANKDQPLPLDPSQELTGALLFESIGRKVFALNLPSQEEETLLSVQESVHAIGGIGLDDGWIVIEFADRPLTLLLLSAQGEVSIQQPENPNWGGRMFWIGENIVFLANNSLLNPFTGIRHNEVIENLPELYKPEHLPGVAISPDLSRALYIRGTEQARYLVLWDMAGQREVWRKKHTYVPHNWGAALSPSIWTKDSSLIAFPYNEGWERETEQIYVVDRNGVEVGIIAEEEATGLSWSPDGRYLAFSTSAEENPYADAIRIYDRESGEVALLCELDEGDVPLHRLVSLRFVWSPDSRYLVYGLGSNFPDDPGSRIVMQNLHTGEVRRIDLESDLPFLIGWSAVSPWKAVSEETDLPPVPGAGQ